MDLEACESVLVGSVKGSGSFETVTTAVRFVKAVVALVTIASPTAIVNQHFVDIEPLVIIKHWLIRVKACSDLDSGVLQGTQLFVIMPSLATLRSRSERFPAITGAR